MKAIKIDSVVYKDYKTAAKALNIGAGTVKRRVKDNSRWHNWLYASPRDIHFSKTGQPHQPKII